MKILLASRDPEYHKARAMLEERGDEVLYTDQRFDPSFCEANGIEWIVSWCYAPIIKKPVIDRYVHRILNVHNSFLPFGRGIYPNVWSFFEDTPKGVTLHFIDEGIDTGDIVVRKRVDFPPGLTLRQTHRLLDAAVTELFVETWDSIRRGKHAGLAQAATGQAGSYHNRADSLRLMRLFPEGWDTPAEEVREAGRRLAAAGVNSREFEEELVRTCAEAAR